MKALNNTPIWRDANRLLLETEKSVKQFPRYYKYTLGSEMRKSSFEVCRLVAKAWRKSQQQAEVLTVLIETIDDLKLQLQLAKELQVFESFAHFSRLYELAQAVGKQSGGWYKQVQKSCQQASGQHKKLTSGVF